MGPHVLRGEGQCWRGRGTSWLRPATSPWGGGVCPSQPMRVPAALMGGGSCSPSGSPMPHQCHHSPITVPSTPSVSPQTIRVPTTPSVSPQPHQGLHNPTRVPRAPSGSQQPHQGPCSLLGSLQPFRVSSEVHQHPQNPSGIRADWGSGWGGVGGVPAFPALTTLTWQAASRSKGSAATRSSRNQPAR